MWAVIELTVLFGGVFALVLALGRVMSPPGEERNSFAPLLLLAFGCLQLNSCLVAYFWWEGEPLPTNLFMCTGLVLFVSIAPLLYFSFDLMGTSERGKRSFPWYHGLPTLSVVVALAFAFAADYAFLSENFHWKKPFQGVDLIGYLTSGVVFAYVIALGARFLRLRKTVLDEQRARINFLLVIIAGFLACVITDFVNDEGFADAAATIILVILFLAENRRPGFLGRLALQDRRNRHEQSRVSNLDIEAVLEHLRRIMAEEELYLDEELSLPDLAERVDLGTHQLSEILNLEPGGGFYGFVNEFRIEHARRLLLEEPEMPILTVGFRSGFNTSSAFYNSFKRRTGKTPGHFRKSALPRGA